MAAARDTEGAFGQRSDYSTQRDARELRAFFNDFDAAIGFRSTFSAMLAAASGVAIGAGSRDTWDPYAEIVEKISEGALVRRALMQMDASLTVVLFRLYGPEPAQLHAGAADLGDLAALAPYTAAAEDAREDLVVRLSAPGEEKIVESVSLSRRELEIEFWTVAGRLLCVEAKIDWHRRRVQKLTGVDDPEAREDLQKSKSRLDALTRRHHGYEELLARLLDIFEDNGVVVRAQVGVIESTDRTVTVDDAIRDRLSERHPYHERSSFIVAVKRQAKALRDDAHDAYRVAREKAQRVRSCGLGPSYDRDTRCWIWP